jgi:hypothetical protein
MTREQDGGMKDMDKAEKVKVFAELFDLIKMYYVERDQPSEGNDFFTRVERCCNILDLDFIELKKEFELYSGDEMWPKRC